MTDWAWRWDEVDKEIVVNTGRKKISWKTSTWKTEKETE
jgi:hypothetical protein